MKSPLFLYFILLSATAVAQNNQQDSLWIVENYYKIEEQIAMRDGVHLYTSAYIPKDNSEKHPILMVRTPYSAHLTEKITGSLFGTASPNSICGKDTFLCFRMCGAGG